MTYFSTLQIKQIYYFCLCNIIFIVCSMYIIMFSVLNFEVLILGIFCQMLLNYIAPLIKSMALEVGRWGKSQDVSHNSVPILMSSPFQSHFQKPIWRYACLLLPILNHSLQQYVVQLLVDWSPAYLTFW